MRLLAIRYPHPNGRRDAARVELVDSVFDGEQTAHTPLRRRLGDILGAFTPGVAWGDGVLQAKALDIKAAELQAVLAMAQTSTPDESIQARFDGRQPMGRLLMQINGESSGLASTQCPELDALARRVDRQGKLITCRTSAVELMEQWETLDEQTVQPAVFHNDAVFHNESADPAER